MGSIVVPFWGVPYRIRNVNPQKRNYYGAYDTMGRARQLFKIVVASSVPATDFGGVSENRGPSYSTLNSRILILRTPK